MNGTQSIAVADTRIVVSAATSNLLEPLLSHVGFAALETADLRSSFATLLATLACHCNAPYLSMIAVPTIVAQVRYLTRDGYSRM